MSSPQNKKSGDGIVTTVFAWAFALVYLVYDQICRPLCNKAYKHAGDVLLGGAASIATTAYAAFYLVTYGYNPWAYIFGSLAVLVVTAFFAYPILHIVIVRPFLKHIVWRLLKQVFRFIRWVCRGINKAWRLLVENWAGICSGAVRITQILSPGSAWLWKRFEDEKRSSWFRDLFDGLCWLLVWTSGAILGYITYTRLGHYGEFVAIATGLIVWSVTSAALKKLHKVGKRPFAVLVLAAASVYELSGLLTTLTTLLCDKLDTAVNTAWLAGVKLEAFVLLVALAVPLLNWIFAEVLTKLAKFIKQLPERVYRQDTEKGFTAVYAHLANFVFSAAAGYYAWCICGLPGLSLAWTLGIVALVVLLAYLALYKTLDHDQVAIVAGIYASLIATWEAGSHWFSNGLPFSYWGAIGIGALTFVFVMAIAYPLLHLLLRTIALTVGAEVLAPPLTAAYDWIVTNVLKRTKTALRHNFRDCYDNKDTTIYNTAFGHVVNLGGAYLACTGSAQLAGLIGITGYWALLVVVPSVVLSYLLIGKLLCQFAVHTVAALTTIAAVSGVLYAMWDINNNGWMHAAMVVAMVAAAYGTWYFAYPAAFRLLRLVFGWLLRGTVGQLVIDAHDWSWKGFVAMLKVADRIFWAVSKWVNEVIIVRIANVVNAIKAFCGRIWRAVYGRAAIAYGKLRAFLAPFWAPIKRKFAAFIAKIGVLYQRTAETYARIIARLRGTAPKQKPDSGNADQSSQSGNA